MLFPLLLACAAAKPPATAPEPPVTWICRPGADDPCAAQPMAEWLPDGTLTRGRFEPDAAAPIDCFYV